MKILKIASVLLLLVSFMACKKERINKELDFKQYAIVGKYYQHLFSGDKELPFIISFGANNTTSFWSVDAHFDGKYTLKGDVLTLIYGPGETKWEFKVDGEQVKAISGLRFADHGLKKVPDVNILDGPYSGFLTKQVDNTRHLVNLKFTTDLYGEIPSIGNVIPDVNYTLISNMAAVSKVGAGGSTKSIFLAIDNVLEVARIEPGANGFNYSIGTLNKN